VDERQLQPLLLAAEIANRHSDSHPWEVAVLACNRDDRADFNAFLVGLLHDSLEDGYCAEGELEKFPPEVQRAVKDLTREVDETYSSYLARVKNASALARKVKLSDAEVNLARCQPSLERRYRHVIEVLS
jgi:(p)ppGpp synthase/HD superfamily hydrolase